MFDALHRAARERYSFQRLLVTAAVVVVLVTVLDLAPDDLAVLAVVFLLGEAVALLDDTPGVDSRHLRGGLGLLVLLGGLALLYGVLTGGQGALWLPVGVALFGAWLLADAAADLYHGRTGETEGPPEPSSGELMLLMSHAHLVSSELEDGPRTVPELATACDLTESRIEETLAYLTDAGVVSADGDRYVLQEENTGVVAFLRGVVTGLVGRITRPFRAPESDSPNG